MVAPEVLLSRVMDWVRPIAPAPGVAKGVATVPATSWVYAVVVTALSVIPAFTAIALTVAGRLGSVKGPTYTVPVLAVGVVPLVVYRMVAPEVSLARVMVWVRPIAPDPGVAKGVATVSAGSRVYSAVVTALPVIPVFTAIA
jgi:hypothetical protein